MAMQHGPGGILTAERLYSQDLLDDILRPVGKDDPDLLDLDGALFGGELWDLGDEVSPTSCPSDGVVPQPQEDLDRASSSSSSSGSGLIPQHQCPEASTTCSDPTTASLLAYFSYPPTFSSQVPPALQLPAPWQMMPVVPLSQQPPPYRPKWAPMPAQVPAQPPVRSFRPQAAALPAVKSEELSDIEDGKADVNHGPVPPLPVRAVPEVEGAAVGTFVQGGGRVLDRKERVRRYQEKRKRRTFEKTIRYQSRKAYAEVRPRIKGRFATREEVRAMKAAAAAGLPYCPDEDGVDDWEGEDSDDLVE